MKICRVCKLKKPLEDFYKSKGSKDGYRNECKKCKNAHTIAWRKADPERYAQALERSRVWSDKYKATPEGRKARNDSVKKCMSKPESRARFNAYVREWSKKPEAQESRRRRQNRAYQKNPEKFRLKQIVHRFGLKDKKLLEEVLKRDKVCKLCGTDQDLTFDHIFPTSLGGVVRSSKDLQILCRPCNSFKNNNLMLPGFKGMMITAS